MASPLGDPRTRCRLIAGADALGNQNGAQAHRQPPRSGRTAGRRARPDGTARPGVGPGNGHRGKPRIPTLGWCDGT
jgi:hypothetical protein